MACLLRAAKENNSDLELREIYGRINEEAKSNDQKEWGKAERKRVKKMAAFLDKEVPPQRISPENEKIIMHKQIKALVSCLLLVSRQSVANVKICGRLGAGGCRCVGV